MVAGEYGALGGWTPALACTLAPRLTVEAQWLNSGPTSPHDVPSVIIQSDLWEHSRQVPWSQLHLSSELCFKILAKTLRGLGSSPELFSPDTSQELQQEPQPPPAFPFTSPPHHLPRRSAQFKITSQLPQSWGVGSSSACLIGCAQALSGLMAEIPGGHSFDSNQSLSQVYTLALETQRELQEGLASGYDILTQLLGGAVWFDPQGHHLAKERSTTAPEEHYYLSSTVLATSSAPTSSIPAKLSAYWPSHSSYQHFDYLQRHVRLYGQAELSTPTGPLVQSVLACLLDSSAASTSASADSSDSSSLGSFPSVSCADPCAMLPKDTADQPALLPSSPSSQTNQGPTNQAKKLSPLGRSFIASQKKLLGTIRSCAPLPQLNEAVHHANAALASTPAHTPAITKLFTELSKVPRWGQDFAGKTTGAGGPDLLLFTGIIPPDAQNILKDHGYRPGPELHHYKQESETFLPEPTIQSSKG